MGNLLGKVDILVLLRGHSGGCNSQESKSHSEDYPLQSYLNVLFCSCYKSVTALDLCTDLPFHLNTPETVSSVRLYPGLNSHALQLSDMVPQVFIIVDQHKCIIIYRLSIQ